MIALLPPFAALAWYLWALRTYHGRHGGKAAPALRPVFFAAGCLAIATVLSPAFDAASDRSFTWHMAQHMVLTLIAPPLLLLGAPLLYLIGTVPRNAARTLARALHAQPAATILSPVCAWLIYVAVIWISHFSALYGFALQDSRVHVLEHALYLFSALLFWSAIVQTGFVPCPVAFRRACSCSFSQFRKARFSALPSIKPGTCCMLTTPCHARPPLP